MIWITKDHVSADFDVPSEDGSKTYVVSWGDNHYDSGVQSTQEAHSRMYDWSCTCPDWRYHRKPKGGHCKHIASVKNRRILWATRDREKLIDTFDIRVFQSIKRSLAEKETALDELEKAFGRLDESIISYALIIPERGVPVLVPMIGVSDSEYKRICANNDTSPIYVSGI